MPTEEAGGGSKPRHVVLLEVLIEISMTCREAGCHTLSARALPNKQTQELYGMANQSRVASEEANPRLAGLFC